jgi:hypothetical protein
MVSEILFKPGADRKQKIAPENRGENRNYHKYDHRLPGFKCRQYHDDRDVTWF